MLSPGIKNSLFKTLSAVLALNFLSVTNSRSQVLKRPIPGHLVVLTFDDAPRSDYTLVAPILKKYGFEATFFVCEFPPDFNDTTKYMTWDQIKALNRMGFEIGNHTWKHTNVDQMNTAQFTAQMEYIENKCKALNIPKPVSFAYPAWKTAPYVLGDLKHMGYLFARQGGNRPYFPGSDHPYLIPSFNVAGNDTAVFYKAMRLSAAGNIIVLTFHGIPDLDHAWVSTPPDIFESYMRYLYKNKYRVISLVELRKYIRVEQAIDHIIPDFN